MRNKRKQNKQQSYLESGLLDSSRKVKWWMETVVSTLNHGSGSVCCLNTGAGWEHLAIKKWLWPKPVLHWLNYCGSVLMAGYEKIGPMMKSVGLSISIIGILQGGLFGDFYQEVLFQALRWSASLGRWYFSLANSHAMSVYVACSSGQFMPLNCVSENLSPSACVEQTTLFNTCLLFYDDFMHGSLDKK